jgi:hypothetical protein
VKGFIGGGKLLSGNLHDEDWRIFGNTVPYSNTQSNVTGDLAYDTFDVGYSVFRGPSANVGGFVGFNYYQENKSAYGCTQIANPYSDCVPALPNSTLGITEDDKWYSLRVGLNGVVTLADRVKLTADAAYLPYVAFRGTDNHLLQPVSDTISPETGTCQGVQLEAILSYAFSNAFSVGAGGQLLGDVGAERLHQWLRHAVPLPGAAGAHRTLRRLPPGLVQDRRTAVVRRSAISAGASSEWRIANRKYLL